jgi:hypothetical protein
VETAARELGRRYRTAGDQRRTAAAGGPGQSSMAQRQTVVHERSYEEVRDLVLLLADQPIGRDASEKLKRIVSTPVIDDRGYPRWAGRPFRR